MPQEPFWTVFYEGSYSLLSRFNICEETMAVYFHGESAILLFNNILKSDKGATNNNILSIQPRGMSKVKQSIMNNNKNKNCFFKRMQKRVIENYQKKSGYKQTSELDL
jgi:hypothetical protein